MAALQVPEAEAAPPPDFAAAAGVGCCRCSFAREADVAAEFALPFAASGAMALLALPPILEAETPAVCGCCLACCCCGCGCFAIAAVAGCSAAAGCSLEGPPGAVGCALLVAAGPTAAACGVDGRCLARPRSGDAVPSARAGLAVGATVAACRWAACSVPPPAGMGLPFWTAAAGGAVAASEAAACCGAAALAVACRGAAASAAGSFASWKRFAGGASVVEAGSGLRCRCMHDNIYTQPAAFTLVDVLIRTSAT